LKGEIEEKNKKKIKKIIKRMRIKLKELYIPN
jgi:hypothetical protein